MLHFTCFVYSLSLFLTLAPALGVRIRKMKINKFPFRITSSEINWFLFNNQLFQCKQWKWVVYHFSFSLTSILSSSHLDPTAYLRFVFREHLLKLSKTNSINFVTKRPHDLDIRLVFVLLFSMRMTILHPKCAF